MFKINYHMPGTAPATLLPREASNDGKSKITLIRYNQESFLEYEASSLEDLLSHIDPAESNWINIDGLSDIDLLRGIGQRFGLHVLALEDVLNTTQRPKLERYDDHIFIVSEMIYFDREDELVVEQVSMFMGQYFLITFQEECGQDIFERVRERLRSGSGFSRKYGTDYLAYALLDATVDQFFPVLEAVGDTVEELESVLMEQPAKGTLRGIYEAKRLLIRLRRAAWPQREIFNSLIRDETKLVTRETQIFIRDCYDHIIQVMDMIENYRELTGSLMEMYLSKLGLRTNEIMRVLTVISSIFIPLTFLAGVYGMNFDPDTSPYNMPEVKWKFGYFLCLGLMLLIALGQLYLFRRKKWI